jgi:hypothetical protein
VGVKPSSQRLKGTAGLVISRLTHRRVETGGYLPREEVRTAVPSHVGERVKITRDAGDCLMSPSTGYYESQKEFKTCCNDNGHVEDH